MLVSYRWIIAKLLTRSNMLPSSTNCWCSTCLSLQLDAGLLSRTFPLYEVRQSCLSYSEGECGQLNEMSQHSLKLIYMRQCFKARHSALRRMSPLLRTLLNDYFASVVQATTPNTLTVPLGCDMASSFRLSLLSRTEVNKALSSIKTSTAPGHGQIPGFVIQKLAYAIAPNLNVIYNSILHNNIIHKSWKMAQGKAVYKQKGSKTDPSNYRPISVLPILGRTLEKLVASHNCIPGVRIIQSYLRNNLVFVDTQAVRWHYFLQWTHGWSQ